MTGAERIATATGDWPDYGERPHRERPHTSHADGSRNGTAHRAARWRRERERMHHATTWADTNAGHGTRGTARDTPSA
jgi:hypothetical protein